MEVRAEFYQIRCEARETNTVELNYGTLRESNLLIYEIPYNKLLLQILDFYVETFRVPKNLNSLPSPAMTSN